MHGNTPNSALTADPAAADPRARRIAELSAEYLETGAKRREAIADEIAGLISGCVAPFVAQRRIG